MLSDSESFGGAEFRFLCFFLAILRGGCGFKRRQQPDRDAGDFVDRGEEYAFVGFRRLIEAADFSYELERGCSNLVIGDGRIEVEESLDVAAHDDFNVAKERG